MYCKHEILGRERGLKFNQYAIVKMARFIDHDDYLASSAYAMVYAGLLGNCYAKREDPDFTFEEVMDWVESAPEEVLNDIYTKLQEAEAYKKLLPKEEGEKKSPETTSVSV